MKPCSVCLSTQAEELYGDLGIVRCTQCRFVYADIEIMPRSVYTEGYFHGDGYPDYEAERNALQRNFSRRLRRLRRYVPHGGRLFEIGCAYGYFLDLARRYYDASGIDICDAAVRYATTELGVEAICGDLLELPDAHHANIDLICMWDVIEHLERPDQYLEAARQRLKPGGVLALTTGDISSLVARVRGRHWRLICPPHHLHYFCVRTLRKLLSRVGFEVVHISHPRFARTYKSAVGLSFSSPFVRSALTLGGKLDFTFSMNTFDLMFVIARV